MNRCYTLVLITLLWTGSPVQAQLSDGFGPEQVITTQADFAESVYATDLDGDWDQDVLSASPYDNKIAWYANDGQGGFGAEQVITTQADGAWSVYASDLDGDGDQDVLSASYLDDKIAWYENDGQGSFSPEQVITTLADDAVAVYAADLDGDGDQDVLSASEGDNKIAWYENDGQGSFGAEQLITTLADGATAVYASDLDGDGDQDVLSASPYDNKIAWYANDGQGGFGAEQVITTQADGAWSVYATDLDGDGDQDALSASYFDDKIAWYANDGQGGFGAQQVITTQADGAESVYATDLDGDGDQDVLSASVVDDKIAWYENDGQGDFGPEQLITTLADAATAVYATDLDGDGDQDVLSASSYDDKIAWYENQTRPNIAEFLLIDAQADQIVQPLADGDILEVSALELRIFSVMAVADNPRLQTVRFHLTGPITQTQLDRTSPFTLFGDNGSDYYGKVTRTGDYTLTATPIWYGIARPSKTIHFRLVPSLIENFTLIDADDDQDLMLLEDGAVIDISVFGSSGFNVRANVEANVVRVEFDYSGPLSGTRNENTAPYALFGDTSGDYYGEEPLPGDYTVTATPYTEAKDGTLVAGSPTTLHFTIAEPSTATLRVYPNSFENEFLVMTNRDTKPTQVQLQSVRGGEPYEVPVEHISREGNKLRITTQHLPSGQYILRMIGRDWTETRHVLKE